MINIADFLNDLIATYNDTAKFLHGGVEDANINTLSVSDEVIYFERPYTANGRITQNGLLETTFNLHLFFLNSNRYHNEGDSDLNSYQKTVDQIAIKPALDSMNEFMAALYHSIALARVDSFRFVDMTDYPEFDENMSGVMLNIVFTLWKAGDVCEKPSLPIPEDD